MNTEELKERFREVHGDKFDYSLSLWDNAKTKVKIICRKHGVFEQLYGNHLKGQGCPNCRRNIIDTDDFIQRSIQTHGDRFDYSKSEYVDSKTKVTIICAIHGEFEQSAVKHINGQKCYECSKIDRGMARVRNIIKKKFKGLIQPEEYKLIPLTQGKFAKVDNEDFDRVKGICWRYSCGYAGSFDIPMHRFIMNTPQGMSTDHINHDTLDNRKSNLRICTHQENLMNQSPQLGKTSKYKGVFWDNSRGKWRSEIVFNNKSINLGRFDDEINAAMSYNKKAIELFGEFANVNVL